MKNNKTRYSKSKMQHGTQYRGVVKRTQSQIKKHYSQLSLDEKQEILEHVRQNQRRYRTLQYTHHAHEKRNVSFRDADIQRLLDDPKLLRMIIECNANFEEGVCKDVRILVRSPRKSVVLMHMRHGKTEMTQANLCFVYSLTYHRIVTVYWNRADDQHDTIDMSRYTKESFLPYLRQVQVQKPYKKGAFPTRPRA